MSEITLLQFDLNSKFHLYKHLVIYKYNDHIYDGMLFKNVNWKVLKLPAVYSPIYKYIFNRSFPIPVEPISIYVDF